MFTLTGSCYIKRVEYSDTYAKFSVPFNHKTDKDSPAVWFNFFVRGECLGYMRALQVKSSDKVYLEARPQVTNTGKLNWTITKLEVKNET